VAKRSRRPVARPEPSSLTSTEAARSSTRNPRPRRAAPQPGTLERYRTLIYGGAAVIGVLIVAWLFLQGTVRAGYMCGSELTPGPSESLTPGLPTPTPSTAPSATPTPRLGFSTGLLGKNHIRDLGTVINYAYCPPTSGDHYNVTNRGPIRAAVYPANEEQVPGGWVHNMEHGYMVALYRCRSGVIGQGDCISQAEMDQLQSFYDQVPDSTNPSCPKKVVVARFDSMNTKFAMLAWGRALLTDTFDLDTALLFDQQWQDQPAAPERGLC